MYMYISKKNVYPIKYTCKYFYYPFYISLTLNQQTQ